MLAEYQTIYPMSLLLCGITYCCASLTFDLWQILWRTSGVVDSLGGSVRKAILFNLVALVADQAPIAAAVTASAREMIQLQIDATDRQIDALVYQLYGLTEDEIKIVEGR